MSQIDPQRPDEAKPGDATGHPRGRGRRLGARAVDEARRFIVLFVYLWILFGLFVLNQRIILREEGLSFAAQGFAVFNAFILAKVMLVLEDLNLSRWLERRPLVYPILHDSLLFAVLFIVFHVVEEVVVGLFRGEAARASVPAIGGGGLAGVVCVAVILFFALIPFFAFRNFNRALGPGRMRAIPFGPAAGLEAKSHGRNDQL